MMYDDSLAAQTGLTPVPASTIRLPWGKRFPEYDRTLYRLVPNDEAP